LDAVAYKKSKGAIPSNAEMLPIPKKAGDPAIVTADDMQGMMKAQALSICSLAIASALHTGQGNTWGNAHYKSMTSEQRAAARAIFAQGEPGFGISACKWMASKHIALQMGDTSANDAQPGGKRKAWPCPATPICSPAAASGTLKTSTPNRWLPPESRKARSSAPLRIIGATGSRAIRSCCTK